MESVIHFSSLGPQIGQIIDSELEAAMRDRERHALDSIASKLDHLENVEFAKPTTSQSIMYKLPRIILSPELFQMVYSGEAIRSPPKPHYRQ